MPEQRKRLHCVAEITLSTTFLLVSEVPAIAAFARSGLHQERNSKTHTLRETMQFPPAGRFGRADLTARWYSLRPQIVDNGPIIKLGPFVL